MLHAVVMAGGSGTRFWPASRQRRPKQFLPITGEQPMIAETVGRMDGLVDPRRVWVVTHRSQAALVQEACPALLPDHLLLEPEARNTAACAGLAATVIHRQDPDACLAVLPADHDIRPVEHFQEALRAAEEVAQGGALVTLGIPPRGPVTGYGYIRRCGDAQPVRGIYGYEVARFIEKPPREKAEALLREGGCYWNSGIFVWRADVFLDALREHMPDLADGLHGLPEPSSAAGFSDALASLYGSLASVPVDKGVMEKHSSGVRVLEANFQWSDVGSWSALQELLARDENGNTALLPAPGGLLSHESGGTLAWASHGKLVALLGVEDLLVVDTEDALLVAHRDRAEEVKDLVERLRTEGREELL